MLGPSRLKLLQTALSLSGNQLTQKYSAVWQTADNDTKNLLLIKIPPGRITAGGIF